METRLRTQVRPVPPQAFTPGCSGVLQRKCSCGGSAGVVGEFDGCDKQGLSLQRSTQHSEVVTRSFAGVPPIVHEVLGTSGQPLDPETRAFMEPRFGHDFGAVRVHTDVKAAESARALSALAYTVGPHVMFGTAQYAPSSAAGRFLLAHELTHVIQQKGQTESFGGRLSLGGPKDRYEAEAERIAGLVMTDTGPIAQTIAPARMSIQRECVDGRWETKYDGCSLPWIAAAALGFGEGDDPAIGFHSPDNPTGERKDTRFAIPETRTGACDRHDACYQMCWPRENNEQYKQACDEHFRDDMLDTCMSTEGAELRRCTRAAKVYYQGVKIAGHNAFKKDQAKSCACEGE